MAARRPTTIQMDEISKKYIISEYLASGGCGTVMIALEKAGGKKRVLKYINLDELTKNKAKGSEREAKLMSQLEHPNIVKLCEVFKADNKLHLIMEYCDSGDLRERIRQQIKNEEYFSYEQLREWMIQLTSALTLMHRTKVLHRDIKPENIFITDDGNTLKIGDLGISRSIRTTVGERAHTRIGTPRYVSPEVMGNVSYAFPADIWSLGVMFVELMTLIRPTIRPEKRRVYKCCGLISSGDESYVEIPDCEDKFGKNMQNIAIKMLMEHPGKRPNAAELLQMFENLPKHLDQDSNHNSK